MTCFSSPTKKRLIFDCDGLLLDTEEIYFKVGIEILAKYGKEYTWDLKKSLMGLPMNESVDLIISIHDLPVTRDEYIFETLFLHSAILPGVENLVSHMHKNNVPVAVASSSGTSSFKVKSMNHQPLFSKFNHIVLGDDPSVKKGKPAPDIFIEAANRLAPLINADICAEGPFPDVLVFEDSPVGVTAARAAGMEVIWIPDSRMDASLFQHDPMVHYLPTMTAFNPADWGLPSFEYHTTFE